MPLSELKERIKTIIQAYKPTAHLEVPTNYHGLKEVVLFQELHREIEVLEALLETPLLSLETMQEHFMLCCAYRAKRNGDSCLSFMNDPMLPCNTMYWDVMMILFEPKSLKAAMAVLLPNVKTQRVIDVRALDPKKPVSKKNLALSLESIPFVSGESATSFSLKDFTNFIVVDDEVMDVSDFNAFEFIDHQRLYELLRIEAPKFAEKLYRHNPDYQNLRVDLLKVSGQNQLPAEALQTLIKGLRLGGEKMTGSPEASMPAVYAAAEFTRYFDGLAGPALVKVYDDEGSPTTEEGLQEAIDALLHGRDGLVLFKDKLYHQTKGAHPIELPVSNLEELHDIFDTFPPIRKLPEDRALKKTEEGWDVRLKLKLASADLLNRLSNVILPGHLNLKDTFLPHLLSLKNARGQSIERILKDLEQGHCVEMASNSLEEILHAPGNQATLREYPDLSPDELSKIIHRYHRLRGKESTPVLTPQGAQSSTTFPETLLLRAIQNTMDLRTASLSDFIILLKNFPKDLYGALLRHGNFPKKVLFSEHFSQRINEGWITSEEKSALLQGLIENEPLFLPIEVYRFASPWMSTSDLQALPKDFFLKVINSGHRLFNNSRELCYFLKIFPTDFYRPLLQNTMPSELFFLIDRQMMSEVGLDEHQKKAFSSVLFERRSFHPEDYVKNLLKGSEPNILIQLLKTSTPKQFDALVSCCGDERSALLNYLVKYPEVLKEMIERCANPLDFVSTWDDWHGNLLFNSAYNPEALQITLPLYAKHPAMLQTSFSQQTYFHKTLLHVAAAQPASLRLLLPHIESEGKLVELLMMRQGKKCNKETPLEMALSHPESLTLLLERLQDRTMIERLFNQKNSEGKTLLELAASLPESLSLLNKTMERVGKNPSLSREILTLLKEGEASTRKLGGGAPS